MHDDDRFYTQAFRTRAPRSWLARLATIIAALIVGAAFAGAMPGEHDADDSVETRASDVDVSEPVATDREASCGPASVAAALCHALGPLVPGCGPPP